ncbi:hypothetical protein ES703_17929 [subsurface metagenome]
MENKEYLYPMEVKCAWCDCHLYWDSCYLPGIISHGICEPCAKKVEAGWRAGLKLKEADE